MKDLNVLVAFRIKMRKILTVIFSVCSILLLCGIFNAAMEAENKTDFSFGADVSYVTDSDLVQTENKKNPREVHMEKKDKRFRLFSAVIIIMIMAASVGADVFFVCCPVCGKHIPYALSNKNCRHCGTDLVCGEDKI